jgi:hypothetical protein
MGDAMIDSDVPFNLPKRLCAAQVGKSHFVSGIGESRVKLFIQLVNP